MVPGSSHSQTTHRTAPRARPPPRPGGKEMRGWDSEGGAHETYKQLTHTHVIWGLEPCSRARKTCRQSLSLKTYGRVKLRDTLPGVSLTFRDNPPPL